MFYVKFGLHVHLLLAFAKKVMYVFFLIYICIEKGYCLLKKSLIKTAK